MVALQAVDLQIAHLKQQITATEVQLLGLQQQLEEVESRRHVALQSQATRQRHLEEDEQNGVPYQDFYPGVRSDMSSSEAPHRRQWPLEAEDYRRYGRQLIMPEIGSPGQVNLKASRVLIIGLGGLGCPAAAYLAAAGVGTLGLVDGDVVEASNLHRQIAHSTSRLGAHKVDSAAAFVRDLNPHVRCETHAEHLTPQSALSLFARFDLVLDCTDNPASRYLVSDACILARKPLVSASALKTDGQLIVLNDPPAAKGESSGGPCYRCIWPVPPPPEAVTSCGEGGILGPVVGVMGVLQALEAIKIITRSAPQGRSEVSGDEATRRPSLLMFSAYAQQPFRSVKMRSRRKDCAACSTTATVTEDSLTSGSLDYVAFCGASTPVNVLPDGDRISPAELARSQARPRQQQGSAAHDQRLAVIDVRSAVEFGICSLPGSINAPWSEFPSMVRAGVNGDQPALPWLEKENLVFVCRQGNDSQLAVKLLQDSGLAEGKRIVDLRNGFRAWRREVDPDWPDY